MIYKALQEKKISFMISLLLAITSIIGLIFSTNTNLFIRNTVVLWGLGMIYLFLFLFLIVFNITLRQLHSTSKRIMLILASVIITVLMICVLPFSYENVLKHNYIEKAFRENNTITIETLGNKNIESVGYSIQIESAMIEKRNNYKLDDVILPDSWEHINGKLVGESIFNDQFQIVFPEGSCYELRARYDENSGIIRITIGENSKDFDLYIPTKATIKVLELDKIFEQVEIEVNSFDKTIFYIIQSFIIFIMVLAILSGVYCKTIKKQKIIKEYK